MKLYSTLRSPFGRKIKIIALEKGIKLELIIEDLKNKSENLLKSNPLGLVPTLVTDDGNTIFDSVVIAEYIDGLDSKKKFLSDDFKARIESLKLSALADGMTENAIAIFYENLKSEDAKDKAKLKKHWDNLVRSMSYLEQRVDSFSKSFDIAQVSIGCAIGYIDFRITDLGWREKNTKLAKFYSELQKRDSFKQTEPRE